MKQGIEIEEFILEEIIQNIKNERYKKGEKLPSDNTIADKYNIPRTRVRNIYKSIEKMGYIYSIQGKGRYVLDKLIKEKIEFSAKEKIINISFSEIKYSKVIYEKLKLKQNDKVYRLIKAKIKNNLIMVIYINYINAKVSKINKKIGKNLISLSSYYFNKGISFTGKSERTISMEYLSLEERRLFLDSRIEQALKIDGKTRVDINSGEILDCSEVFYRIDKFKYIIKD